MSEDSIISVCDPMLLSNIPFTPPLCQSTLDPILLSNDLERQLRALTVEHRKVLFLMFIIIISHVFVFIRKSV